MNKSLVLMFGIAILLGFTGIEANACSCDLPPMNVTLKQQVKKAKQRSEAVFVGKVLQVVQNPDAHYVSVKFLVEKVWKGSISKEVSISTGLGGGDCGFPFEVGENYLVYAYGSNKSLGTNVCQRTAPRSDDGDLKFLGKGNIPIKD